MRVYGWICLNILGHMDGVHGVKGSYGILGSFSY